MRTKQVNNLTLNYSSKYNNWRVVTPDKKVLEEFDTIEEAEKFARGIKDFRKIQKVKIPTSIDELCNIINEDRGLKPNDIGSIEHYTDMCENSIVQICNEHRGVRQLVYGSDDELKKYLYSIIGG